MEIVAADLLFLLLAVAALKILSYAKPYIFQFVGVFGFYALFKFLFDKSSWFVEQSQPVINVIKNETNWVDWVLQLKDFVN